MTTTETTRLAEALAKLGPATEVYEATKEELAAAQAELKATTERIDRGGFPLDSPLFDQLTSRQEVLLRDVKVLVQKMGAAKLAVEAASTMRSSILRQSDNLKRQIISLEVEIGPHGPFETKRRQLLAQIVDLDKEVALRRNRIAGLRQERLALVGEEADEQEE